MDEDDDGDVEAAADDVDGGDGGDDMDVVLIGGSGNLSSRMLSR